MKKQKSSLSLEFERPPEADLGPSAVPTDAYSGEDSPKDAANRKRLFEAFDQAAPKATPQKPKETRSETPDVMPSTLVVDEDTLVKAVAANDPSRLRVIMEQNNIPVTETNVRAFFKSQTRLMLKAREDAAAAAESAEQK